MFYVKQQVLLVNHLVQLLLFTYYYFLQFSVVFNVSCMILVWGKGGKGDKWGLKGLVGTLVTRF